MLGAAVSDAAAGADSLLTVGATIGPITAGGPADTAGLKAGDVITKVGDRRMESADALVAAVRAIAPDTTYTRPPSPSPREPPPRTDPGRHHRHTHPPGTGPVKISGSGAG